MSEPQPVSSAPDDRMPVGRSVLAGLLLRRFGLLPMVALVLAGRGLAPARRRGILTAAAGIYLGALLLLVLLVLLLVGGLTFVALTG
ncbi:hypothetical protein ACFFGH_23350 [Lysobacter korlensis]|uniref:DUF4190 domain-containing protein n=1 Tax=Lysobacter korlensis TaxID=553636 RepID=A0ABV6RUX8_9GAMM